MGVERLAGQVSGRGPAWYAATAPGGARSRRAVLSGLVADLARLGEPAGTGQPPGVLPPELGAHVLVDQLLVLGRELETAPHAAAVTEEVDRLVAAARSQL